MKVTAGAMAIASLALAAAVPAVGLAETVGYDSLVVPPNTDVYVSVPFTQNTVGTYTVTAVAGDGVTVADTFTSNQYATLFYIRFTSGAANGKWATITSNDTHKLFITMPAGVAATDTFAIYPHQTLATVFSDDLAGYSFVKSTSTLTSGRRTQVILPDIAGVGIDKSPAAAYYFLGSANEWRQAGGSGNKDNVVLPPQSYFILSNTGGTPPTLYYYSIGDIATGTFVASLQYSTVPNDNYVSIVNPLATTLAGLNLGGTAAFVTSTSTLTSGRRDQVLLFDNAATGSPKSPAAAYYYFGGQWRKAGDSAIHDNDVIPAGAALLIRKYQQGSVGSVDWIRVQSF